MSMATIRAAAMTAMLANGAVVIQASPRPREGMETRTHMTMTVSTMPMETQARMGSAWRPTRGGVVPGTFADGWRRARYEGPRLALCCSLGLHWAGGGRRRSLAKELGVGSRTKLLFPRHKVIILPPPCIAQIAATSGQKRSKWEDAWPRVGPTWPKLGVESVASVPAASVRVRTWGSSASYGQWDYLSEDEAEAVEEEVKLSLSRLGGSGL